MPVGAAIGVGALTAGGAVASAKIQSNAAKSAAKGQVASQDTAQQFNQQAFRQQQAALNPYIQGGQDAFSRLMSQHFDTGGLSAGMRGTAVQPGQTFTPPQTMPGPSGSGPLAQAMTPSPGMPAGQPLSPQGAPAAMGGPTGPLVAVRAPTGEMARFPAGSPGLMQALQKGAVRV